MVEAPELYPQFDNVKVEVNEDIPSEEELEKAICTSKNNKSSVTDKLKTEALKYNISKKLINALVILFMLIWTCISIPVTWLHSSIIFLHMKGPMGIAKKYHGLLIGVNMSCILAKIIIRLKEAYESNITKSQFGFR